MATTIFTPPAGCLDGIFTLSPNGNDLTNITDSTLYITQGFTTSCFPSGLNSFTPGLFCPQGYTTATLSAEYYAPAWTTTAICCPSDQNIWALTYDSANELSYCRKFADRATIIDSSDQTTVTTADTTTTDSFAIISGCYILAPPISLVYQSSDLLEASTSASTLRTAAPSSTTSIPAATTSSTAAATTTSPPPPALTTGAKAGVGVGAAIAGIALISGIVWFILRRRRTQKTPGSVESSGIEGKPELPGEGIKRPELGAEREVFEAHGNAKAGEADDMNFRAELEGDWRGYEAGGR